MAIQQTNGTGGSALNKTQFIIVRSGTNTGKTTTIGLVLLELLNQGAILKTCTSYSYSGSSIMPLALSRTIVGHDFYAELNWQGKFIIINSAGDIKADVQAMLNHALSQQPDYIICASRSQNRTNSSWELFKSTYTNLLYKRVCFWSEYTNNKNAVLRVKQPVVDAIIKSLN